MVLVVDGWKCIYMHRHIVFDMTKVISLSEKAYETLKSLKKPGESFSDVVIRVGGKEKKRSILEFAGTWEGDDIDEVFTVIIKDREKSKSRELDL
jgi:predicted CopG family antitoxin